MEAKDLTPVQRRELRARAHHLHPVVLVGDAGVTPQVLREVEASLKSHELIKVRLAGDDREARAAASAEICDSAGATEVQQIGKILVIYRPRSPEDEKAPTRRRARKTPRRTKRSFQGS